MAQDACLKPSTLQEIKQHRTTALRRLWLPYSKICDELSFDDEVVVRGESYETKTVFFFGLYSGFFRSKNMLCVVGKVASVLKVNISYVLVVMHLVIQVQSFT